jgi:RimJ/RimL family protein N-acetyltransferase
MDSKAIAGYRAVERLQDGGSVTIRAIRPEDKAGLIDALERVSAESLYTRFFSGKQEFSDAEMTRMVRVDFGNVVALVAVLEDEGAERIVGGARYFRLGPADSGQSAEVAFMVDDAHQGLGIGSRLLKHLAIIARASGIDRFEAEVLPSNSAMLGVFERSGLSVARTTSRDSVHLTITLVPQ